MFGSLSNPQNLIWLLIIAVMAIQGGGGPLPQIVNAAQRGNVPLVIGLFISAAVVLLISFPLHELGHALAADKLGDPTPRRNGRISLNPFVHLDPMGSTLFLLLGFGWATTPVNYGMLRGNPSTSRALVALAGPAMNFACAIAFALIYNFVVVPLFGAGAYLRGSDSFVTEIVRIALLNAIVINVVLGVFNLFPLPPLDGWSIARGFLPGNIVDFVEQYQMYFSLILFVTPIVSIFTGPVVNAILSLLT
jgi:Zn-dependent protease